MNNHSPRPFVLAETNWKEIQEHQFDIAVLPWGATEAHNYHMPYATDNYQVLVLPNIPYGVNTGQLDVPFCINMNPSTQLAILNDVCDVVRRHGVTKLVILNGHGANNFVAMIRELAGKFPDLMVSVINWFTSAPKQDIFEKKGDHADEMESSVMMHLHPSLLLPLSEAGDGSTKQFDVTGIREGWAWTQRPWTLITKDTGSGDPSLSTPEKGNIFLERCTDNIANFFAEINNKTVSSLLK